MSGSGAIGSFVIGGSPIGGSASPGGGGGSSNIAAGRDSIPTPTLDDYLELIPPYNAQQPDFLSVLTALLQPVLDTQQVIGGLNQDFDLDIAIGAQLDVDGIWIGRSRFISVPITDVYFSWDIEGLGWEQGYWQGAFDPDDGVSQLDDETYRKLLYAKAAANESDGSLESIIEIMSKLLDGEGVSSTVYDNQDMTMRLEIHGVVQNLLFRSIITGGYLPIKPAGVGLTYLVADAVQFPVSATITGLGGVQARAGLVKLGSATINGRGAVSIGGFVAVYLPFNGVGSVTVRAVTRNRASATFGGNGTTQFNAIRQQPISVSIAGTGSIQASAAAFIPPIPGVASLSGQGNLAVTAVHSSNAALTVLGSGSIQASAVVRAVANSTITGVGSDTAIAATRLLGRSTVTGAGSVSVPAILRQIGISTLQGAGSLTTNAVGQSGLVFNVHIGLTAWINHTFAVGERCSNADNAYQCITAGTSTVAPTGTSANSAPGGTAHFKWLSAIDYTDLQTYADNRETPRAFDHTVLLWNDALIQCTANVELLYLSDNTTGAFKTLIKPAPGESFRDNATSVGYDATKGVAIQLPVGTNTDIVYIYIEAPNVTFDGIQFKNPQQTGTATPLAIVGANATLRGNIFDVYGRESVKNVELAATNATAINNLFVDRHSSAPDNLLGVTVGTCNIVNNTFIATVAAGVNQAFYTDDTTNLGRVFRNNCIFGWGEPTWAGADNMVTVDHCVTDSDTIGDISIDGGNNLLNRLRANQFVSATTDFRLKSGADCINAGITDLVNIPTGDDILRRPRTTWDVGCYEF